MRWLLAAVLLAVGIVPAEAHDAEGKVVLGFGAGPDTSFQACQLQFQSVDGEHSDFIQYTQTSPFFGTHRDFDDASENGAVKILTLPAGNWIIWNVMVATFPTAITTPSGFAIPFTVKAGETVYIGDYRAHSESWQDNGRTAVGGLSFDVSDQSARDIPIAKQKDKDIGDVTVAIPDIAAANVPYFHAAKN
jgi:opacity protein-like surface antigen